MDGSFRFFRVAFGGVAMKHKSGFFSEPNQKKEPGFFAALEKNGSEFRGWNRNRRLQIGFHGEDLFFTHVKFDGDRRASGAQFSAVQNELRQRHGKLFVFRARRVRGQNGRQQNRCEEKRKAENGSDPALRKREWEKDERGAEKSKSQTRNEPGMLIAAGMEQVRNSCGGNDGIKLRLPL